MMMHSLRPHTMEGHMAIYKYVLHHSGNTVPKWFLETLGVWVSSLNECMYCVEHHFCGLQRLLKDDPRADAIRAAIEARAIDQAPLDDRQKIAMEYARQLTESPAGMTKVSSPSYGRPVIPTAKSSKSIRFLHTSAMPIAQFWVWDVRPTATFWACRRTTPIIRTTGTTPDPGLNT